MWRGGTALSGVLCNISTLGVYVTLDDVPAVGETVEISFVLPGGDQPVDAEGVVTWQNLEEPQRVECLPPGCGVRFTSLSPADHARIEALVLENKDRNPPGIGATLPKSGFVRVPFIQRCRVAIDGVPRSGVVCNLSLLGVYVTLDPLPEIGRRVQLSFLLPGDPRSFQSPCTVMWLNAKDPQKMDSLAPGCGLRFDMLLPEERRRIERVVADYCAGATPSD
jgi:uncharacterized protein (TIGR02266 family)